MYIRSITCFCNPGWPINPSILKQMSEFIPVARQSFQAAGYEVQSSRLTTIPFHQILGKTSQKEVLDLACEMETCIQSMGIDYVSLGPALPQEPNSYAFIAKALGKTQNVFFSAAMDDGDGNISMKAVRSCAEIIYATARLSSNGFTNLRFAALANVPAGAPFFPAAYHSENESSFALACEAADIAVEVFTKAQSLDQALQELVMQVERNAQKLTQVAKFIQDKHKIKFTGIDFTLAPFPEVNRSIGTAIERMGIPAFGLHGSLAAAALLTSALERAKYLKAGFNGLMLPVLEDSTLAARASQGYFSLNELLLYSAVCGTGLDTIPLPGDITVDQLSAILLDLAALAVRLDKPLTARLMPIPGSKAGELTKFDFAYFANSRIFPIRAQSLGKLFYGAKNLEIQAIQGRKK